MGNWTRCVVTGPPHSAKTLAGFVIPLLYHLPEIGKTVICGLPDIDIAIDKWLEDILPAIEQPRFRDLMPRQGGGSRDGRVESLQFLNGGFTSRVVGDHRDRRVGNYDGQPWWRSPLTPKESSETLTPIVVLQERRDDIATKYELMIVVRERIRRIVERMKPLTDEIDLVDRHMKLSQ
jgi:hypothetical protein